ncbi:mitochondrial import inner membrane translocase subunit Tim21-like isoform X1 [Microplitis mediator]|uniref:mitochondrial import inner membrane translocase subunit Tim21-like isoform X1 n=1 Tax=Microplitis mediator TaxID=375433 RepID=UPI0025522241|nr:mitochondrial import inner membrane translocase subunit Tim21-like isoform X1 [Microplitis mediator]XP_057325801.1 mitochondrial import inner membrane translocase subunit Tim21-like isoform X1 [Microplitis mediator]
MASIRLINNVIRQKTCHYNRIPSLLSPPSLLLLCNGNKVIIKKYSNEKQKFQIPQFDNDANNSRFANSDCTETPWDVSQTVVAVGMVGIMAFFGYVLSTELLSDKSPYSIYCKAADRCRQDPKVTDALGGRIHAQIEKDGDTRRCFSLNYRVYQHNGRTYMRMKFYIQGVREGGTVNLDMRRDDNGNVVYRYLFVQLEDASRSIIVLEDNRAAEGDSNKSDEFAP